LNLAERLDYDARARHRFHFAVGTPRRFAGEKNRSRGSYRDLWK
jgi:hypothetical protein